IAVLLAAAVLVLRPRPAGEAPVAPAPPRPPAAGLPPPPLAPPPEAAFAAFAVRGIAPPRTVSTRETAGEVDREWVRTAIAEAEPVDPARFAKEDRVDLGETAAFERAPAGAVEARERFGAPMLALDELQGRRAVTAPEFTTQDAARVGAGEEEALARDFAEPQLALRAAQSFIDLDVGVEDETSATPTLPRKLDPRALEPPRLGKILFQNEEGKLESLVPRALRVQAFVEGPRARTVVDYVFSNPHDRRLQGTFYYPLPAGASPAAFGMFRGTARIGEAAFSKGSLLPPLAALPEGALGLADARAVIAALAPSRATSGAAAAPACLVEDWGEIQTARVVAEKRAREVYEQVVRRDIDPALLEWSGGNTFQARVFPIEPRSVKRVVLVYEQTLPLDRGLLRYAYPLPEAEELGSIEVRLAVAGAHAALRGVAGLERLPAPSSEGSGWTAYRFAFQPGKTASADFALEPRNAEAQVLEASSCRELDGSVFFARLRPPVPSRESAAPTGRALFLVDTSLSAGATGAGFAAALLEEVLESDATVEEYAVLLFDIRPRWLHAPRWRPNEAASRAETAAELGRVYLEGATSFDAVLGELDGQAGWLLEPGRAVCAFLLSDGFITWGQDRLEALLKKHLASASPRWISYQLGSAPSNRALFDALSRLSGGRTVTVLTREELRSGAKAHRTAPVVLEGVRVEGVAAADLVVAGDPKLLFEGQELQVAGRLPAPAARAELVVEASLDGKREAWRWPLSGAGASVLAPRAWAELHAARLLALDDERLDRMVVALSQRFHLANRAASLLVLDDEKDYEAFDLKGETVDLEDLEALRAREEDRRLDRLQGIALDGAAPHVLEVIALLEKGPPGPRPPSQPFLDRPLDGGEVRMAAEAEYREARSKDDLDLKVYDAVARARALAGDTAGALRAYSSLVEKMPSNAEAARLAGYACMALGQHEAAAEVFERVRLQRPFEPQAYLEEALALEALGLRGKAARDLEIVLHRDFPRHSKECKVVAAYRCARILKARLRQGELEARAAELLERRLGELAKVSGEESFGETDLQLSIHWSTDATDIDLWVVEPGGERCYYEHKETAGGGKLFWDVTDGYGPEIYQRRKASSGSYEVLVHYYGNRSPRWSVPTAVLYVRDRGAFGPEDELRRRYRLCLLGKEEAVLALGAEEF
ncbi:MAG: tetratricopeptide repeat protein, partial [Planctomycetes bacterium]|nr:tetratricopeptide repeat protein [Planctomycetota bacterium]